MNDKELDDSFKKSLQQLDEICNSNTKKIIKTKNMNIEIKNSIKIITQELNKISKYF
jgi:hypothetical protein